MPDYRFKHNDIIVVIGKTENMDKFEKDNQSGYFKKDDLKLKKNRSCIT